MESNFNHVWYLFCCNLSTAFCLIYFISAIITFENLLKVKGVQNYKEYGDIIIIYRCILKIRLQLCTKCTTVQSHVPRSRGQTGMESSHASDVLLSFHPPDHHHHHNTTHGNHSNSTSWPEVGSVHFRVARCIFRRNRFKSTLSCNSIPLV